MNDRLKTQLQETGECDVTLLTVLEVAEIVSDLGLNPRGVRIGLRSNLCVTGGDGRILPGQSVTLPSEEFTDAELRGGILHGTEREDEDPYK